MRIVVTGGTGFIGREIVKRLLDTPGDEIVVATRDPERAQSFGGLAATTPLHVGDDVRSLNLIRQRRATSSPAGAAECPPSAKPCGEKNTRRFGADRD